MSRVGGPANSRDTIVAIATPSGPGAVGLVRVSGPCAVDFAAPLLRSRVEGGIGSAPARTLTLCQVVDPRTDAVLDQALVSVMPGPRSYTGETVVEISCHGSPVVLAQLLKLLVEQGARLAEPGEFTRRAYLNGRMDLLQAEAVALLIRARTESAARLAAQEVAGELSLAVGSLRDGLLDLVAALEVALDFPDDEIGMPRPMAVDRTRDLTHAVAALARRARHGRIVQDGLTVAIVGSPNVGKSSLLNKLVGRDRAIVSPEAGTTRDIIESWMTLRGVPVRLIDGAGLGVPNGIVEEEGMRRSRAAIDESDLVLVVLDHGRPVSDEDRDVLELTAPRERIIVANKSDLPRVIAATEPVDCCCSALTGAGIDHLRRNLEDRIERHAGGPGEEGGVMASARVGELLERTRASLECGREALEQALPLEASLIDLRDALTSLGDIVGIAVEDAVLDRVFATFCVGK